MFPWILVQKKKIYLKNSSLNQNVVVVQLLIWVQLLVTPWIAAHQVSLSFIISWSLLKFIFIESLILFNHLILCCPLLLLPSSFPSIIGHKYYLNFSGIYAEISLLCGTSLVVQWW